MHCTQRKIHQNAIFGQNKMFIHLQTKKPSFQNKKGNEEAENDQFQVHAFFHSRHLKQIVDNQPVHRLTQSGFLISLLLLVNNHLELQNRSSKAEKAGSVLSSTLGDLSPGFKFVDADITLRSSAAKSSFIWQNRKWSSDGLIGLSSLFWFGCL